MKEEMLNEVIRKYGFEHPFTIAFAEAMKDKFYNLVELIDFFEEIMEDF